MKPRYYQEDAVEALFDYFANNTGNPVVAKPTGTGKSIVIAEFSRRCLMRWPNTRLLVLTHVKELVAQNHGKLLEIWPTASAGIFSAGLKRKDFHASITFAGIGSIKGHAEAFGYVDLVVIDECHTVSPKEATVYRKFLASLKKANPHLKVIGLTATPYRLGQGLIIEPGGIFTDICFDITGLDAFNKLLAEGFLCPLIPKRTKSELDVSEVATTSGDYNQGQLQAAVDREEITRAALEEALTFGANRRSWLVFAAGIEHTEHVAAMLAEMGIPAVPVHSKSGEEFRDEAVAMFKAGKVRALVNNGVFTTGFDYPGIDLILVLRPTMSPGLWVQMLGRGTRPVWPERDGSNWDLWPQGAVASGRYNLETDEGRNLCIAEGPKPDCLVLDFAGNTRKLGPVNDPKIPAKRRKGAKQDPPAKCCDVCGTWNHTSARFCIDCKEEFPPPNVKIKGQASVDELIAKGKVLEEPLYNVFDVDSVTYEKHVKGVWKFSPSSVRIPPSLKVTYHCGLRQFTEFVNLEHPGPAGANARGWWAGATFGLTVPPSIDEALKQTDKIRPALRVRVWTNKKPKPEVLHREYI